ncbi:Hypoxia-inducible factor 1 alpha inhibitor, putative [Ricinus communis]|uniref:Hypoxia-inducible factor 1 alpha inhibitor, putative n=1 Tax=Ricinus communis TaxID=3988 RepID=B9S4N8_RICCO|nr:Hypoxia-inducible factor 1 alpha inhibitor, putative [Ricinus communis]
MGEEIKQWRVKTFEKLPSAPVFASQIESENVPAAFNGYTRQWKAFTKWNPANGGLDYLQERVGSSTIEAMLSRTAPVFYGDLRSHERVPFPFSTFIDFCKQRIAKEEGHQPAVSDAEEQDHLISGDYAQQVYLAQVPIMNTEDRERVQLATLREDIQIPAFLESKELASINLWMNNAHARSSTHYDPHHNVLSIVAGRKQVTLWPPSASPFLYPMPIYGEASNHSSVALENPDFSLYPRAQFSLEYSQKVVLHAGDALFIPEGWFHQVDSDDLTIAVNFWWRSNIMSSMLEHMDAYYLRRILRSHSGLFQACEEKDSQGKDKHHLNVLESFSLQALHELVSLVHDCVNLADPSEPVTATNDSAVTANLLFPEDDAVAKFLGALDPHTLQNVLLSMAHNFPRTLEALVLHLLSPAGAEVLTRKFDEIDQQNTEEDRNKFYRVFYGAFDDQFAAMDAILNAKESFAFQAFKNVLDKYLGVNSDVRKPSVG